MYSHLKINKLKQKEKHNEKNTSWLFVLMVSAFTFIITSCGPVEKRVDTARSGVKETSVQVETDINGLTAEQKNVKERLIEDNKPGAIKHFYLLSAYSGQVLMYSTVKGKVTSSGKRLSPTLLVKYLVISFLVLSSWLLLVFRLKHVIQQRVWPMTVWKPQRNNFHHRNF